MTGEKLIIFIRKTYETMLTSKLIRKLCYDFVNDPDTTIAMECNWEDWLVRDISMEYSANEIMQAFNVTNNQYPVLVQVQHKKYGDTTVYVAIYDNLIRISTRL